MGTQLFQTHIEEDRVSRQSSSLLWVTGYFSFVKLRIDIIFILVAVAGAVLGENTTHRLGIFLVFRIAVATLFLAAGAESWTNIIDRHIDAVMPRTATRPLPAGTITVKKATYLATTLTASGFLFAFTLGAIPFLFFLLAFLNNVIVYSLLTKKATPWSIVLGSPVAPFVLWAGYTSVSIPLSSSALLLGFMLMGWIPVHIWIIAIRYRQDYRKAGVPMAPIVWGRAMLTTVILLSGILMSVSALTALISLSRLTPVHLVLLAAAGAASLLCLYFAYMASWRAKIFSSSIMAVTFYLLLILPMAIGFKL